MKTFIISACVISGIGLLIITSLIDYSNREVVLRNKVLAQQEANHSEFDKMWKTVEQTVQVSS